jgi:hypothetical protein
MKKWNVFLSLMIVGVLLIPATVFGSVASACCGTKPIAVNVTDNSPVECEGPIEICVEWKVTADDDWVPYWGTWTYDTGVEIKIYDAAGNMVVDYAMTVAADQPGSAIGGEPGQGDPTPVPYQFCYEWDGPPGNYTYTVVVWSTDGWPDPRSEVMIEGGEAVKYLCLPVDIKPESCPNPINLGGKGVLPVAIAGMADFDVATVDAESVRLAMMEPLRWNMEDVATPYEPFIGKEGCYDCTELGADGYMDLSLKFDNQAVAMALEGWGAEDGDCWVLRLTGNLMDGTPFIGEDVLKIVDKE